MSYVQNDDTPQSNEFFCKEGDNNEIYNRQQKSHSIDTQNLDQLPSISPEPHVDEMKLSIDELSSQDNGKIENEDNLLENGLEKIEFASPLSVATTAAATATTSSNEKEESSSNDKEDVISMEMDGALAQLVSMGFEITIARVALKKNEGRDFDTVVHWLLQQKDEEKQKSK
ncbi:13213_t:CDS:1, partial [Acaulospora morrowiae]